MRGGGSEAATAADDKEALRAARLAALVFCFSYSGRKLHKEENLRLKSIQAPQIAMSYWKTEESFDLFV